MNTIILAVAFDLSGTWGIRLMKKSQSFRMLLLPLASILLASTAIGAESQKVGVNAAVKGDVFIEGVTTGTRRAKLKDDINLGETVDSQSESALQILLLDETTFTVGPECVLTIDEFVYDPNSNAGTMTASLAKGAFRFMSGKVSNGTGNVKLNTPVASMGVRGTVIEGIIGPEAIRLAREAGIYREGDPVDREGASLILLRGPGRQGSGLDRRGDFTIRSGGVDRRLRKAGMAVFVGSADMAPSQPFAVTPDMFQKLNITLRTRPTQKGPKEPFPIYGITQEGEDYEVDPLVDPRERDPLVVDWPDVDCFLETASGGISRAAGNGAGPGPGPSPIPCFIGQSGSQ
jgi:hypothetical protein